MVPRFTEFYIPVLQVLSNIEKREVNALIDEVADQTGLSDEARKITTKSGNQARYRSNIQWAITDLCQAGYVDRPERAHYIINIDGLAMLEDNPSHPDRDYLYQRSDRFKTFVDKKGTRSRRNEEGSLFEDPEDDDAPSEDAVPAADGLQQSAQELQELYDLKKRLERKGYSTDEVDADIKEIKSKMLTDRVITPVTKYIIPVLKEINLDLSVVIDFTPGENTKVQFAFSHDLSGTQTVTIEDKKSEEIGSSSFDQKPRVRTGNKTLVVTMPDGKVLKDASATDILEYVIQYVGPAKVAALGIKSAGMQLVSRGKPKKYSFRELNEGYYLTTNNSTPYKKIFIEKIAEAYHLAIKAAIID